MNEMKKDFFFILLVLVLIKIAASPLPKLQNQPADTKTTTNSANTDSGPAATPDCTMQNQQDSDELSLLTNQTQDPKANPCLFLGCNGFF